MSADRSRPATFSPVRQPAARRHWWRLNWYLILSLGLSLALWVLILWAGMTLYHALID